MTPKSRKLLPLRIVLPSPNKVKIRKGALMPSRPHKMPKRGKRGDWKSDVADTLSDLA